MNLIKFNKAFLLPLILLCSITSCKKEPDLVYPTVAVGSQSTVAPVIVATVEGKSWYVPSESLTSSFNSVDSIVSVSGSVSDVTLSFSFYAKDASKNLISASANYSGATYVRDSIHANILSVTTPTAYIGKGAAGKFTFTLSNAANANTVTFSSGSFLVKY